MDVGGQTMKLGLAHNEQDINGLPRAAPRLPTLKSVLYGQTTTQLYTKQYRNRVVTKQKSKTGLTPSTLVIFEVWSHFL